jgi:hypothetical protein
MCLEKISLDLEGGKETGDEIVMLRIISERALDIDEELRACFIDWQKAFDRANDQIYADPERNWYRLGRKKIDQQIVRVSDC